MASQSIQEVPKVTGVYAKPGMSETYQPYVPDDTRMPEFTWSAVVVGACSASCLAPRRSTWSSRSA